jgi:uncharacterized protein YjaG (DUF416 family)
MEKAFDRDALTVSMAQLSAWHRLVMGALVCERLVPNYCRFEDVSDWRGYAILRNALDTVWVQIGDKRINTDQRDQMLRDCDKLVPSADEFSTNAVSMAIDAASSVCVLLEAVSDTSPEKISEICTAAVDTIDMYIQRNEFADCVVIGSVEEAAILAHPLMQTELKRQREDYQMLVATFDIGPEFIADVRRLAEERGSNLTSRQA